MVCLLGPAMACQTKQRPLSGYKGQGVYVGDKFRTHKKMGVEAPVEVNASALDQLPTYCLRIGNRGFYNKQIEGCRNGENNRA